MTYGRVTALEAFPQVAMQSSGSPQLRQTSSSTPSPQSSRRSNKKNARKKEAEIRKIDTEQQALPTFLSESYNVENDDDVQMEKALEDSSPFESRERSCGVESKDTAMTVFDDAPTPILSQPSQPSSPIPIIRFKNLPVPAQGPTPSRTRSGAKLDQAPKSRVLKNTNKKPAKKVKAFTEKQAVTLLDVASNEASTIIGPPPFKRSERLREKAVVSAAPAVPQLNADHPAQPSQQRQPHEIHRNGCRNQRNQS